MFIDQLTSTIGKRKTVSIILFTLTAPQCLEIYYRTTKRDSYGLAATKNMKTKFGPQNVDKIPKNTAIVAINLVGKLIWNS